MTQICKFYCQEILPDILKVSFIYSVEKRNYSCLNWKVRFCNWTLVITATAIPKMRIKLILWNSFERMSVLQSHRILINWIITYEMRCSRVETYQSYRPKPTDTYGTKERCVSDLGWLALRPIMQQYYLSAKGSRRAKSSHWTFRTCCLNWCY